MSSAEAKRSPLVAVVVLAVAIGSPSAGKQPFVEGDRLDFDLPDLSGEPVSSADPRFAGKVLLVDLWATWCPPCISEIPTLVELQARHRDGGLVIVAIAFEAEDQGGERRARLREFVAEQGINYLVLDGGRPEDFDDAFPSVKNVRGFPVEILIDRSGGVASSRNGYGYKKKWAARLGREIEALLAEP
jgi:thiol-disulfide isomerase/thioredoxin